MNYYRIIISIAFSIVSAGAIADVYKCSQGGRTVYSDTPCSANATSVGAAQDNVSERQQREAEIRNLRNKAQVHGLEARDLHERADKVRDSAASEIDRRRKKGRCEALQREAENARNEAAKYRYHQGLIDDARRREKEAKDRHFTECYGQGNY